MSVNSSHEEEFLKKLTELTEANLTNEQFGVSELAREMGMSRSNLHRKVILYAKTSVSQFIRQIRLKRAMELLLQNSLSASEVSYQIGFGSVTYFTKCFHDFYGFPPGEVGKRDITDTDPNQQTTEARPVTSGKRLQIAILLTTFLVFISVTILFLVFHPFSGEKNKLEKSIAVLPFIDDSPDEGNTYIINGLREEILDKLEKISDLKVKSRTAAEKYKDSKLSIREIGRNLKVNYILEGSGQKIQDRIKLRLQLIEVQSGNHVWSRPYVEEVTDERIFELQEDVAFRVANELKAIITPEEKEMVVKRPTENLAAYKWYLQGLDYLNMLEYNAIDELEIRKAKHFFDEAIKLDTSFAEAYVRLGYIHIGKLWYKNQVDSIKEQHLDSGLMMANKTLLYDDKNIWANKLRGTYYLRKGMLEKARSEYSKWLEYANKKDFGYYEGSFYIFIEFEDYYSALKCYYKYLELKPEEILTMPEILNKVCECYNCLGYPETARKYAKLLLQQNNDSLQYLYSFSKKSRNSLNISTMLLITFSKLLTV